MYIHWTEVYRLIAAIFIIGIAAVVFFLGITVFRKDKENQLVGGMKSLFNIFSLKGFWLENLVKLSTLSMIAYNVLCIPLGFSSGFMNGLLNLVHTLIFEVIGIYVAGMAIMMLYRVFVTVSEINARDKGEQFDPANPYGIVKAAAMQNYAQYQSQYQQPAPVAQPQYQPVAAPIPEPVAAPIPEPVAAPIPEPVAAPIPEPVAATIPEPVAAPIPEPVAETVPAVEPQAMPALEPIAPAAAEKNCASCGKSIKSEAKFCPYCGSGQ